MDPVVRQLTLLLTSPRVAPGLLSASAWEALRAADHVLARDVEADTPRAVAAAGVAVRPLPGDVTGSPQAVAGHLLGLDGDLVWVGSPDGDPGLAEALAVTLPEEGAPTLELLVGSWDTPGARLLDAVAVMDRLRSPGGCPWDAEQTHAGLTRYLIEEAHEAAEVLEQLDDETDEQLRQDAVDELGDVLLQVLFHARVGAEHADDPFDIDDVAATLVAKLVRRHPHVFAAPDGTDGADHDLATPASVEAGWERIKAQEQAAAGAVRNHPLDGVPTGMPPLARAAKVASRLERHGRGQWLQDWSTRGRAEGEAGADLLAAVLDLRSRGLDPDGALRHTLRALEQAARAADED
ncbi:MazG nucleotide pyrophosphohydrolase domain-containing protein [Ornithinimicrobium sp. LYQ92]|uniref:MazG nucleotide pyrophosphohydrolase domain-containing protein n=1 Tax=Serinicoccus sp. LYQ92 TaxID=3378798 RepID=UPI0038531CDD